jgi:hypothetical protein
LVTILLLSSYQLESAALLPGGQFMKNPRFTKRLVFFILFSFVATGPFSIVPVVAKPAPKPVVVDPATLAAFSTAVQIAGYAAKAKGAYETVKGIIGFLSREKVPTQQEQFDALHRHLDDIGISMVAAVGQSFQDLRVAWATSAIQQANQELQEGRLVLPGSNPDNKSLEAVNFAKQESSFQRKLKGKEGLTYDWRVGLPHLMYVISARLVVLAAMDPHFQSNGRFRNYLIDMRDSLAFHMTKMESGVKCRKNVLRGECLWGIFNCGDNTPPWNECVDTVSGMEEEVIDTKTPLDELSRRLRRRMPFFEARAMIDTLNYYLSQEPDLTENTFRIALEADPGFCLDIPGNGGGSIPTILWQCHGGANQQWVYDRATAQIWNSGNGKCLDVQWNSHQNSTPVWTWDCNGHEAQQWTWDPETKVMESAVGLALELTAGNISNGTPIVTWPRNNFGNQRWVR